MPRPYRKVILYAGILCLFHIATIIYFAPELLTVIYYCGPRPPTIYHLPMPLYDNVYTT